MGRNPRKTGQRAMKSRDRLLKAIELRTHTQMTWDEIAGEVGYSTGQVANQTVSRFIDRHVSETIEEYRTLIMMRLEKLYQTFIDQAVEEKDLKAAEFCRGVLKDMAQTAGVKGGPSTLNLNLSTGPNIYLPKAGELETVTGLEIIDGEVVRVEED